MDSIVQSEIDRLADHLKNRHSIDQTRVGLEIEFSTKELVDNSIWKRRRKEILEQLTAEARPLSRNEQKALSRRRAAIATFNKQEIMMYDLLAQDAAEGRHLEPLFGKGHDGDGYYDGHNCLELKIAHTDVRKMLSAKDIVLRNLAAAFSCFGLEPEKQPAFHINASFWRDGKNLFLSDHPHFHAAGKEITQGITRTLFDASLLIINSGFGNSQTRAFDCSFSRTSFVRAATGRNEIRLQSAPSEQDPDLITLLVLAGAIYGLEAGNDCDILPARMAYSPTIHHKRGHYKILSHLLGNAEVLDCGKLNLPEDYMHSKLADIFCELGLLGLKKPLHPMDQYAARSHPLKEPVVDFLRAVRIQNGHIIWPETSPNTYVCVTPEVNMNCIPRAMQQRIRSGEDVSREEMDPYVSCGDSYPQTSQQHRINLWPLRTGLRVASISQQFIVSPGYDMNDAQGYPSLFDARAARLVNSPALSGLRPEIKRRLDKYGPNNLT